MGHAGDALSPTDDAEAGALVQTQARDVLGEHGRLDRPDARTIGAFQELGEQPAAHAAAGDIGMHIDGVLDNTPVRVTGGDRTGGGPPDHPPVLVDGALTLYVERGGRTLLSWTDEPEPLTAAAAELARAVRRGALGRLTVEKADGAPLLGSGDTALRQALQQAGFVATPRGLRISDAGR